MNDTNKKNVFFRFFLKFIMILGFLSFFSIIIGLFFIQNIKDKKVKNGNVAHIYVNGPIIIQDDNDNVLSSYNYTSAKEFLKLIEKIKLNRKIKALVIEINSPGGTPVASEEIASAIKSLKIPKVAWIREIGTSGAYWIAMACDHVVAHPLSITGSIGVLANSFGAHDLLAKFNIKFRRLVAGDYKDIGTPFREQTDEEKKYLQDLIDKIHNVFIERFAEYRKLSEEEARNIANGMFYIGSDALDKKMIDSLGSYKNVYNWLNDKVGEKPIFVKFGSKANFLQSFFKNVYFSFEKLAVKIFNSLTMSLSNMKTSIELM